MIFRIGLILAAFVTIPVFIIGALIYLVAERDLDDSDDEPEVCGNCEHCFMDFGAWKCFNEESFWFNEAVELYQEGCSKWESDSK